MSQSTAIIYGRGFETTDLTLKNILRFIAYHRTVLRPGANRHIPKNLSQHFNIIADTIETIEFDKIPDKIMPDQIDEILDKTTRNAVTIIQDEIFKLRDIYEPEEMMPLIIAFIICSETDVRVEFQHAQSDECEGNPSILFTETSPWYLNNTERELKTQEDFDSLLIPYINELMNFDKDDKSFNAADHIDDLKIEYYG